MKIDVLLVNCYERARGCKMAPYVNAIRQAAHGLALAPEFTHVTDSDLAQESLSGGCIIVSGSRRMVGDGEFAPELVGFLRRNRRPLLGICYGHQVLAKAFAADVIRDRVGHAGRERIFLRGKSTLFAGFPESFSMRVSHREVVSRNDGLTSRFVVLAETGSGAVEAIGHRRFPLFGVQFHPERSASWGVKLIANFLEIAATHSQRNVPCPWRKDRPVPKRST